MGTEAPGNREGRIIGRAVFLDGKEIVLRRPASDCEWDVLTQLHFAIARYLSSDGSFGLYDASVAIKARDDIMRIVSPEAITAVQRAIRESKQTEVVR